MTTSALVDLYDPDTYLAGPPHEAFAALRRASPVHWQEVPTGPAAPGYWAVLGYAEVEHVLCAPELFSSEEGGVVLDDLPPDRLAQMRGMLLAMDPPRHRDYRRPLAHRFTHRAVAMLEGRVRDASRVIMREAAERGRSGGEVEFVSEVAGQLPTRVVGELMGLPREDWDYVHRLAEALNRGQDAGDADRAGVEGGEGDKGGMDGVGPSRGGPGGSEPGGGGAEGAAAPTVEMAMYAAGFAARRRAQPPRDDLTGLLLAGDFGGRTMSDLDYGSFFVQLVTAGNDTTQTMLSSGLLALLTHPDQLAGLRADPSLAPGAVEEILRWANPLHYFRRTAAADAGVGGVRMRAGDRLATYFTAANRDETVFEDPDRFDIRRSPNRHLSFGKGEHFCLGAHLARLEGRVFLEELLSSFAKIELAGTPTRVRSNLNNGLKSLPVRLTPA
ncbi:MULTISPECIES: cytochrome P450 [unclassified Pseudofrankia]|uniref:cytochrome P450 n=1 Tax=unclassified Pseudofrankia TaxID=2994372 RepID=UPI0008D9C1CD|nr:MULTISPECIES: cytochrome P450 [unclassified Pseudofrankia]MDT3438764.1 cytochrome P450 [Pseudofrankia sp. BMG5.37]OHV73028.1 cytochrome [Pseudofrankia sp. BMG5.36]